MTSLDPDVWPKLWTALGKLVISSGGLEETVRCAVLNMMGGPHWRRTELVIDSYSARQMNERAERLAYQVLEDSLQKDVIQWIRGVRDTQTRRNKIIHSSWTSMALTAEGPIGPAAMSRTAHKAKRGMVVVSQELTPEEIDNVTAEISRVELEGNDLIIELQDFSLAEGGNSLDLAPWSRQRPPPAQDGGASAGTLTD
jgi:hypothetical protein